MPCNASLSGSTFARMYTLLCLCVVWQMCAGNILEVNSTLPHFQNLSEAGSLSPFEGNDTDHAQAFSCGNGESLSFYSGTRSCCSTGTVSSGRYTVGTGSSDSHVEFWIARGTSSTWFPASLCKISSSGSSCSGSACQRRGSKYDCNSPTIRASDRLCARYKCNNWLSTCQVSSFRVSMIRSFTYSWLTGSWRTCSSQCTQTRSVTCRRNDGQTASDSFCSGTKPPTSRTCTGGSCTYSWQTGSWATCSSQCTQSRSVSCRRNDGQSALDSRCSGTKPSTSRGCSGGLCMPAEPPAPSQETNPLPSPTEPPPSDSNPQQSPGDQLPGNSNPATAQESGTNQASCVYSLFLFAWLKLLFNFSLSY